MESEDGNAGRDPEREARLIEAGHEAIRQGRYIADENLDAWLDGLDQDPDFEIPLARCLRSDS